MIYGYIRVSTDKQTTENQRFEILKFASEKRLHIDQWVEETISATRHLVERQLGQLLDRLQPDDVLVVTELSRLGRSLLEVMSILHRIMERDAGSPANLMIAEALSSGTLVNRDRCAAGYLLSRTCQVQLIGWFVPCWNCMPSDRTPKSSR